MAGVSFGLIWAWLAAGQPGRRRRGWWRMGAQMDNLAGRELGPCWGYWPFPAPAGDRPQGIAFKKVVPGRSTVGPGLHRERPDLRPLALLRLAWSLVAA